MPIIQELVEQYIGLQLLIGRLVSLADGLGRNNQKFRAIDDTTRYLEAAAEQIKSAAHRVAYHLSGELATEYRDVFIHDRWQQYAGRYTRFPSALATGTVSSGQYITTWE